MGIPRKNGQTHQREKLKKPKDITLQKTPKAVDYILKSRETNKTKPIGHSFTTIVGCL